MNINLDDIDLGFVVTTVTDRRHAAPPTSTLSRPSERGRHCDQAPSAALHCQ